MHVHPIEILPQKWPAQTLYNTMGNNNPFIRNLGCPHCPKENSLQNEQRQLLTHASF